MDRLSFISCNTIILSNLPFELVSFLFVIKSMLTIRSPFDFQYFAAGLLFIFFFHTNGALAAERGLAWGANDAWAPNIALKPLITWAHHWQLGPIKTLPDKVEYVPTNWGPKYSSDWAKRVVEMNCSLPNYILAYNEPDVVSQANMTPLQAALGYIKELEPYRQMGVQVSSPQIAWNYTWLDTFLTVSGVSLNCKLTTNRVKLTIFLSIQKK